MPDASLLRLTLLSALAFTGGCATIRVTDPPRTADEEFLLSAAADTAVSQLSTDALRDRDVWVETAYVFSTTQPYQQSFLVGEVRQPSFEEAYLVAAVRAKLLKSGVRLAPVKEKAQVILELRSGGLSIDRIEYLLGIPAGYFGVGASSSSSTVVPLTTPELAILKSTKQHGYASVSFVAYWADTGELLAASGPTIGRTYRDDYWIFGTGPRTFGNIPPTQPK